MCSSFLRSSLTRGQVVRDDVVGDISVEDHLEAGEAVVAERAVV